MLPTPLPFQLINTNIFGGFTILTLVLSGDPLGWVERKS